MYAVWLGVLSACANAADTSSFTENPFYNGGLQFSLEKGVYSAGEAVNTRFYVSNMEDFPIANAYLVVEIVKGGFEPVYPSYTSDTDNIFYEEIIKDINLPPLGETVITYSYTLPEDVAAGEYRMEAYLKTERTNIVGLPNIMQSPEYRGFRVSAQGSFPHALISRTETVFVNERGSVGAGVDPEADVQGRVVVKILPEKFWMV